MEIPRRDVLGVGNLLMFSIDAYGVEPVGEDIVRLDAVQQGTGIVIFAFR